jgi:hypothetical protein
MNISYVHLPKLVRPPGQQLIQLGCLVYLNRRATSFVQKSVLSHHPPGVAILDLVAGTTTDYSYLLVTIPRIQCGSVNYYSNNLLGDRFTNRTGTLTLGCRYAFAIPARMSNA